MLLLLFLFVCLFVRLFGCWVGWLTDGRLVICCCRLFCSVFVFASFYRCFVGLLLCCFFIDVLLLVLLFCCWFCCFVVLYLCSFFVVHVFLRSFVPQLGRVFVYFMCCSFVCSFVCLSFISALLFFVF